MSDENDKLRGKAALDEIGLRLNGLIGGLKGAVEEISERVRAAQAAQAENRAERDDAAEDARDGETVRRMRVDTPSGEVEAVASWRVGTVEDALAARRARAGAEPAAEPPRPRAATPARECVAELFEEADAAVATFELPGVREDQIDYAIEAGRLALETAGPRRFRAELTLPDGLAAERASLRLQNGICEIRIPKS